MGGAFAETDSLRQIDSGNIGAADDVERTHRDNKPPEPRVTDGAILQQALGADALADMPLPPPRVHAPVEHRETGYDEPLTVAARPVGRVAVRDTTSVADRDRTENDGPEPAENVSARDGDADTADTYEEGGQPELATDQGDGGSGGPDTPTRETGDTPEEPESNREKGDGDLYKYDEEKDFTPDPRLRPLPRDSVGKYGITVLDKPEAQADLTAEQEVELAKDIEAGLFAGKLLGVFDGTADLSEMDAEEAAKLTAAAQRYGGRREELEEMAAVGKEARDTMITHNLKLSFDLAMKQARVMPKRSTDEPMDVVVRANDGLIHAAQGFDYKLGNKFSTYAVPRIKRAMQRGRYAEERTVRLPEYLEDNIATMSRAERDVQSRIQPGEEVTAEAIAAAATIDMGVEHVKALMSLRRQSLSLHQTIRGSRIHEYMDDLIIEDQTDEGTTSGAHTDPTARAALARVAADQHASIQEELLGALGGDHKLYDAVVLKFGLFGNAPQSYEQIGARYDVSKESANRWARVALEKLRADENAELLEHFR